MAYQKSDVHTSAPLSKFALKYMQEEQSMVADLVAPQIESAKEQDLYYTFDRGNWRLTDDLRAPGAQSNRSMVPILSTSTFNIQERSLHDIVPYRVIEEADTPLEPKQDTVADLVEQLLIAKEYRVQTTAFASASSANYITGSAATQWGYTTTVSPIDDVATGQFTILKETGKMPNQCVVGADVWKEMKNNENFTDRIKYSQKGILNEDLVAACLDIDRVVVGKGVYMSTAPGITSEAVSYIWGKNCLLQYINPRPRKKGMSHLYQFTKKGGSVKVKEWEEKKNDGVYIEAGLYYDTHVVSTYCGYLMVAIVA